MTSRSSSAPLKVAQKKQLVDDDQAPEVLECQQGIAEAEEVGLHDARPIRRRSTEQAAVERAAPAEGA